MTTMTAAGLSLTSGPADGRDSSEPVRPAARPDTTSPAPGRAVTPPLRAIAGALAAATVTVGAMAIWVGTGRVITADATVAGLVALLAALTLIGPHTH